jgi:DNA-directed RNA polymerase subunit H (RpoH/RPB5)
MASHNLISTIYNSRVVLLNLMAKQGYDVTDYDGVSVNEVSVMKNNNQLDMILEKMEPDEDNKKKNKIYIRYYLARSLRPQNLQEMIDDLFNIEEVLTKEDTLLIVVKDEVNETLTNALKHIWEQDKIFIIIQNIKRLQFNILDHVLVRAHRVLKMKEVIAIKSKYNVMDDTQFPELSRFDPVAKAIGIRPGEVCEIIRPSKTAIEALFYRICV